MHTASFSRWLASALIGAMLVARASQPTIAAAQAVPRTTLVARAYDNSVQPPKSTLLYFAPSNPQPLRQIDLSGNVSFVTLSLDGRWIAQVQNDEQGNGSLVYGLVGQPAITENAEAGTVILRPQFSPDSQYLTFSAGNFSAPEGGSWQFTIIELATGARKVFAGSANFGTTPPPSGSFQGMPLMVAWPMQGQPAGVQRLIMLPLGVEGSSGGPFEVDLSAFPWSAAGHPISPQPFPSISNVLPTEFDQTLINAIRLSDDQSRLAFGYYDPKRPVPDYVGFGDPLNTLGILNTLTGQLEQRVEVLPAQAISAFTWSFDATQVLFVSGTYVLNADANSSELRNLQFFRVDGATGQLSAGNETPPNVFNLQPCGDALFYTAYRQEAEQSIVTVYSAPASTFTPPTELASSIGGLDLVQCVPQP